MRRLLLVAVLVTVAGPSSAHNFKFTDVRFDLPGNGTYTVDVVCDLDALALGVPSTADSAALAAEIEAMDPGERDALVEGLMRTLRRRLRVRFDGEQDDFDVSLPARGEPPSEGRLPTALGLVARLSGRVPVGAKETTFFASRAFPPVRLDVTRAGERDGPTEVLPPGARSRPIPLTGPRPPAPPLETFGRYVTLGVTHILPWGLDHVLFVLGLALLSPRLGPLLAQVTAFTAAHTLTLALSSYGVVRLPPEIVEPLIALSIVYVAVENVVSPKLRPSRVALVFSFGLLHGLGFAGVLGEIGLPEGQRVTALLAFNVGVELGQLAVIGLAVALVALWVRGGGDRRSLVRSASILIASVGLYWFVQRIFLP
jgi:hypothetical protein